MLTPAFSDSDPFGMAGSTAAELVLGHELPETLPATLRAFSAVSTVLTSKPLTTGDLFAAVIIVRDYLATDDSLCDAFYREYSGERTYCTRPLGHDGGHAAYGLRPTSVDVLRWED